MKSKSFEIPVADKSRKKRLLRSSFLRRVWNQIGKQKKYLNCFGCGDSLWWKEDVGVAFTKPESTDSYGMENGHHFNFRSKPFEPPNEPRIHVDVTHGMIICWECFIKKSEQELMLIFDNVKMRWMKNKSTEEERQKIRDYKLLLPIRTTTVIFKKEMTEIPPKCTSSFEQILPSK